MSVQMLRAWNGYEQHQVYTFPNAEEARLVAAGLARFWSSGTQPASPVPVLQDAATRLAIGQSGQPLPYRLARPFVPGVALIANPVAIGDYTIGGSPSVAEVVQRNGRRAIRLRATSANAFDVQVAVRGRSYGGKGMVVCEFPNPDDWAGGNLALQLATDGNYTNRMAASATFGTGNLFPGICSYAAQRIGTIAAPTRFLEWDGFGTVADDATMHATTFNNARVRFTPKAGSSAAEVYLYGAWVDAADESPSVIITIDDMHESVQDYALDILERHGLRCTLGYIHDSVMAGGTAMTVAECQAAVARGHEIVVHGCKSGFSSLRDYNGNYDLIREDIRYNRDGLIANGLARNGSEKVYIYPQGFFRPSADYTDNKIVQALKDLGFVAARLAAFQGGMPEPIGWADSRYFIPILGHNYNYSGSEANNLADLFDRMTKTAEDGLSIPTMWHVIVPGTPAGSTEVQRSNFERFCEHAAWLCATGRAVNRTLTEHVARCDAYLL